MVPVPPSVLEKCENRSGKQWDARGRRADSEAQIMAVPTSMTDQFTEPTD
jgi:hypothetical protein